MPFKDSSPTPLEKAVDGLPGKWYRRREVALALGVSPSAISMLYRRRPEMAPQSMTMIGKTEVYLYEDEDIEMLRAHFHRAGAQQGRPRVWTVDEADQRERAAREARHLERKARRLAESGDKEQAAEAASAAQTIRRRLKVEAQARKDAQPKRKPRMSATERDHRRLAQIETEYRTTVRVVAVLVERLLSREKGAIIVVKDAEMQDPPDLIAHRDDARSILVLKATR